MVKIHWLVYIIIGGGVLAASKLIERLDVFFWVGLAFLAIGIFKLVLSFITKQKESPAEVRSAYGSHNFCRKCGSVLMPNSRFCSSCGQKV